MDLRKNAQDIVKAAIKAVQPDEAVKKLWLRKHLNMEGSCWLPLERLHGRWQQLQRGF